MSKIDDARKRINDRYKKLSGGDDAAAHVDEIEELVALDAELAALQAGELPEAPVSPAPVGAAPADVPVEPAEPAPPAPEAQPAPESVAAAAQQNPTFVPAVPGAGQGQPLPAARTLLAYKIDPPEGQAAPSTKAGLGRQLHERLTSLHNSGTPGATMPLVTYKAKRDAVVDDQGQAEVSRDLVEQRAAEVTAAARDRINTLASMTPQALAASRLEFGVGFCAPPTPRHQFCEVDAVSGILDLATFTMPPAGVRLPTEPDLTPVWNNLACLTEAEEIARIEPKPCWTVECTSWVDVTPCILPMCIEVGTLTRWAFPALVDKVLAEAMRKFEQFVNTRNIAAISASVPASRTLDFTGMLKTGALNDIISTALIAASQLRTKYRVPDTAPLRLVVPDFVGYVLASDANRRAYDLEMLALARSVLETVMARQAIDVVFVYDYQDAQATGVPGGWGGDTYRTEWPDSAELLLFFPDSWQEYREELIRVQGLRQESTLLRDNKELALFTESAHATVQRCKETLKLIVPLCPAGTHQEQTLDPATACPI